MTSSDMNKLKFLKKIVSRSTAELHRGLSIRLISQQLGGRHRYGHYPDRIRVHLHRQEETVVVESQWAEPFILRHSVRLRKSL